MKHIISIPNNLLILMKNRFHRSDRGNPTINVTYRHNIKIMICILVILIFSLADGILTLEVINKGGREVNPIMDFFLGISPFFFMTSKLVFATIGVSFLFVTKNIQLKPFLIRVHVLFPVFAIIYGIVVLWGYFLNSIA